MPRYFRFFSFLPLVAGSLYLATFLVTKPEGQKQQPRNLTAIPVPQSVSAVPVRLAIAPSPKANTQRLDRPKYFNKDFSKAQVINRGTQIELNGRVLRAAWSQWQAGEKTRLGISDTSLMQALGVELLNNSDPARQPVQWFTEPAAIPITLAAWLGEGNRYLDVTELAQAAGWQWQVRGDSLNITSAPARIFDVRQGKQAWGDRYVIDLDNPAPWQVTNEGTTTTISVEAVAVPALKDRFTPPPAVKFSWPFFNFGAGNKQQEKLPAGLKLDSNDQRSSISIEVPKGWRSHVWTTPNPHRIVVDVAPNAVVERDILWAKGVRWRQRFINLDNSSFPVIWLEVNLQAAGMALKPILSQPDSLVGIAPLLTTARNQQAAIAINGGFFNRNQQLPLGAIRQDGSWLSSPILNRGAIAWNDLGNVRIDRLSLEETLTTGDGQTLPILFLNSGYVQAGIARYTPAWGNSYTPLINDEIIVVVQNDTVTKQILAGEAGKTAFPIPRDGYLLALRAIPDVSRLLPEGTIISLDSSTSPGDFNRYPNILGAGPLLLRNRQIVLDAKGEKFRDDFISEMAIRSAIATDAAGNLLIIAVKGRAGGAGPTLAELARIIQQLGAVDALNLDGGSSTSLYLGGQLIDRSPVTAARVHNGLGIFLQPSSR